jgi:acetoin utilization deacetylase AcuC-like enzyme
VQKSLSQDEVRQINLPIDNQLVKRSFLALNGTFTTALKALEEGIACHAAGGTHHAHYSNGLGYCVFNDLAFTALNLIEHGLVEKVLILDLDVHQGDGTIDICNGKTGIYTCSLHCEQNFPFQKRQGTLDVALNSHLEDTAYLDKLHSTFKYISKDFTPDIVLYDAGVDVFSGDQLGNLNLTLEGILKRDCAVLEYFKNRNTPIATVIGGGYSPCDTDIARRHLSIFRAATDIF